MKPLIDLRRFHEPLAKAGLVPQNCKVLNIQIGVSGALTVTYEVFWEAKELAAFGEICQQIGAAVLKEYS